MKYFTFFSTTISAHIKKKKIERFGHGHACSCVYGCMTHLCISDCRPNQCTRASQLYFHLSNHFIFFNYFFFSQKNFLFIFYFIYISHSILLQYFSLFSTEHHPFTKKNLQFSLTNNKIFTNKSQTYWQPLSKLLKNNIASLRPTYQFLPIKFFSQPPYQSSLGSIILNIKPQTHQVLVHEKN